MKSISLFFSFVSIPARSPGFSIIGPEVEIIFVSNSFAIIFASVVFPRPGGPVKRT